MNIPVDDESAAAVLVVELGAVVSACDEHGGVVVPEAALPWKKSYKFVRID